jgi:hypothetical protein
MKQLYIHLICLMLPVANHCHDNAFVPVYIAIHITYNVLIYLIYLIITIIVVVVFIIIVITFVH